MRALLLTQDFPPALWGGISTYYCQLARCLRGELSVLAPAARDTADFDRAQPFAIHRRRIPISPPAFMTSRRLQFLRWPRIAYVATAQWTLFYRHALQLVSEEGVDVTLLGHLYLAPLGPRLRRAGGVRYGVMLFGSELHRYMGWRQIRRAVVGALNSADFLVVISDFTRRQYLERGVYEGQRFLKVNPGVDSSHFRPGAGDPEEVRRRHALGDRPILLSVARLVEWKGQDTVLRALPEIRVAVPDAAYLVVGEGPYRPALEALVRRLGLERHVFFAGHVPGSELPSYYRAADVMVVPSREFTAGAPAEGFGIVYVEAGACGTPVVGGRGGGTEESIADGVSGFRVDSDDPSAVAAAVLRILQDRELAERMGRAGRERAVDLFDWSMQAERLRDFLRGLVGEG